MINVGERDLWLKSICFDAQQNQEAIAPLDDASGDLLISAIHTEKPNGKPKHNAKRLDVTHPEENHIRVTVGIRQFFNCVNRYG